MSNRKSKSQILNLKTKKSFAFCVLVLSFAFCVLRFPAKAVSPTPSPLATPSASLTPASPASPRGEPTASQGGPTTTLEDEKIKEIRDSLTATGIQTKLNQIKEKIEKKAYVGTILEITDSTLTISNFRGKQRVRLTKDTKIILANKKEGTVKDLAVEDKIIALGEVDANGTLEAKRVVGIPKPKTPSVKRLAFYGTITEINLKTSTLILTGIKNLDQIVSLKLDKDTNFINPKDLKATIKLKDLQENQKLLAIYNEPIESTVPKPTGVNQPLAKTIFILP